MVLMIVMIVIVEGCGWKTAIQNGLQCLFLNLACFDALARSKNDVFRASLF